jgi:hypothetical protein
MDLNFISSTFGRGVAADDAVRCSHLPTGSTTNARKRNVIRYGKFVFAGAAAAMLCCAPGNLSAQNYHWHHRGGSGGGSGGSGAAQVASLTCTSASLSGAGSDACTVSLAQAMSSSTTVTLASSSGMVAVPASIAVVSGATSASFAVSVAAVTSAQTATLTATNGTSSQAFSLQLNPAASTGSAGMTLASTSVAFGNVNLNTPATQTVLLTSSGTAPLTVSAATIQGTGFTMSGITTPATLNPGQTAILSVQFNPTAAGAASGTLTISSNAASGGTATIALSGTGAAATSYEVQLSWAAPSDSSDAVTGYNVYRAANGGAYQKLNSSVNQPTAYTDSAVQTGTTYTYEVTSVDASGVESAASNVYSAVVP